MWKKVPEKVSDKAAPAPNASPNDTPSKVPAIVAEKVPTSAGQSTSSPDNGAKPKTKASADDADATKTKASAGGGAPAATSDDDDDDVDHNANIQQNLVLTKCFHGPRLSAEEIERNRQRNRQMYNKKCRENLTNYHVPTNIAMMAEADAKASADVPTNNVQEKVPGKAALAGNGTTSKVPGKVADKAAPAGNGTTSKVSGKVSGKVSNKTAPPAASCTFEGVILCCGFQRKQCGHDIMPNIVPCSHCA